jgi:hypothetical protein
MIRWMLFFLLLSVHVYGQKIIEGTVVDKQSGDPIPYVSIGILGTHKGTSSNYEGQFSLAVTEPCQIKISCIGYESRTFHSTEDLLTIELNPIVTELSALYVYHKPVNPNKVVQKAFARVRDNYSTESFLQKYFYRHYCRDDSVYGRLIEASVEVWKQNGYKPVRNTAGDKESIRITQLRRSLDKTFMAQGHPPISVSNILQADMVAYQSAEKSAHLSFYDEVNNLKADWEDYDFTYDGTTTYDGQEVYKINYNSLPDSILTTSGYIPASSASGSLYITTDSYAIIKTEDKRRNGLNTIRTSALYNKQGDKYFPYHFIREGESLFSGGGGHAFHIEMISIETQIVDVVRFTGLVPSREELLKIPYDPVFWSMTSTLKATPLEDKIILDLGGGRSLQNQFLRYQQYEWSTHDGGVDADKKIEWLLQDSKGERIIMMAFWDSNLKPYFLELEHLKRLNKIYRGKITFMLLSLENEEEVWRQLVTKYNLFAEGILNYRIGTSSEILKSFPIKSVPAFYLIKRNGETIESIPATDPSIEKELINSIGKGQ